MQQCNTIRYILLLFYKLYNKKKSTQCRFSNIYKKKRALQNISQRTIDESHEKTKRLDVKLATIQQHSR